MTYDATTLMVLQAELRGILPVQDCAFMPLQQSAQRWSSKLKQACAVCNSLNMVNKYTVAGIDMERALFQAVEARFLVCLLQQSTSCKYHTLFMSS